MIWPIYLFHWRDVRINIVPQKLKPNFSQNAKLNDIDYMKEAQNATISAAKRHRVHHQPFRFYALIWITYVYFV